MKKKSQRFFLTKRKWNTDYISNNGEEQWWSNSFKTIIEKFPYNWPKLPKVNAQNNQFAIVLLFICSNMYYETFQAIG